MRSALITGISGQDGGFLAERLIADGVQVHAVTHPEDEGRPQGKPGVQVHPVDLRDSDGLRRLMLEVTPDEIYNLAALSSVAASWHAPGLTGTVNGLAAVELMAMARLVQERHGTPVRFVQASSAEIFGEPAHSPQDESTPVRPLNPYGASKAYAHLMVEIFRTKGLHGSSLILYNHESPRRPLAFVSRKISAAVAAIARGSQEPLVLGNLEARRDWGWAPDYVEAMILAARAETPGDYVIATGVAHSVEDFVVAAFRHVGMEDWRSRVRTDPGLQRPAEAAQLVGNPAKALRELGWKPQVPFEDLVGLMVDADLALLDCTGSATQ